MDHPPADPSKIYRKGHYVIAYYRGKKLLNWAWDETEEEARERFFEEYGEEAESLYN
jgi:hypothetical protein